MSSHENFGTMIHALSTGRYFSTLKENLMNDETATGGEVDSAEKLYADRRQVSLEIMALDKSVVDNATANAAIPKIQPLQDRLKAIAARTRGVIRSDPDAHKKLTELSQKERESGDETYGFSRVDFSAYPELQKELEKCSKPEPRPRQPGPRQLLPKEEGECLSVDEIITRLQTEFGSVVVDRDQADEMISKTNLSLLKLKADEEVVARNNAKMGCSAFVSVADRDDDGRVLGFFLYPDDYIFIASSYEVVLDLVERTAAVLNYSIEEI